MVKLAVELEKLDLALDNLIDNAHSKGVPYTQILKMFMEKQATLIPQVVAESHLK